MNTTATDCKHSVRGLTFLFLIFAVVQTGCVLSPLDEQVISDPHAEITFSGYTGTPGQAVILEYKYQSSQWIEIAPGTHLTSATVPTQVTLSADTPFQLFPWTTTVTLPDSAWTGDSRGRYAAQVRARLGGSGTLYFGEDFRECASPLLTEVNSIATSCSASGAGSVFLYLANIGGEAISADMDLALEVRGQNRGVAAGLETRIKNRGRTRKIRLPRYRYINYSGSERESTAYHFDYTTASETLIYAGGSTELFLPLQISANYPDRVAVEVIGANQRGKLFINGFNCLRRSQANLRPVAYECRSNPR